jgi:RsiW-degrading membrane proteinase PrsW (M82 family)
MKTIIGAIAFIVQIASIIAVCILAYSYRQTPWPYPLALLILIIITGFIIHFTLIKGKLNKSSSIKE